MFSVSLLLLVQRRLRHGARSGWHLNDISLLPGQEVITHLHLTYQCLERQQASVHGDSETCPTEDDIEERKLLSSEVDVVLVVVHT